MRRISRSRSISDWRPGVTLECLPAAAYTCDADGLITYFNRHALQLWGREPKLHSEEDRFCGSFRLFYENGKPMPHRRCWMAKALRNHRAYRNQPVIIERADHSRVTALANANPMFDESGTLVGAANVLLDVTRTTEISRVQARLAALVDSSDDSITSTTIDGYLTSWNAGATRIFGYTAEEVLGKHISLFVPPEQRGEQLAILERLKKGERVDHFEATRRRRDGREVELSLTMSPLRDAGGRVVGVSAIARDVTERNAQTRELGAAKESAEAANRMKDRFLAVVGHELRTPLNGISLAASALMMDENLSAAARARVEAISRNVSVQSELIEDLLDHSRIAAGQLRMQTVELDLDDVVHEACESIAARMARKSIRLSFELDTGGARVSGDRFRLRQVFLNLLENALKFTPAGGDVRVSARRMDNGRVAVKICDTGAGIPTEFMPRLFDAFETGPAGSERYGGLGLGLAICKSLVERHGGTIAAHSEGPGHGATFVIDLPVAS